MSDISLLSSVAVGSLAAWAGVYAGPRVPERPNVDRALGAGLLAAATALVWGFMHDQLLATMLPFLLVGYVAGQRRARSAARLALVRARTRGPQPSSSSSPSPSRGSRR